RAGRRNAAAHGPDRVQWASHRSAHVGVDAMTCSRNHGIALLLVLASLVMVTGVLGLLTLSAAQAHRASQLVIDERRVDDLLASCEAIVNEWLTNHAPRAAVDPESGEPKVEIASI